MLREISDKTATADQWIAEYLTKRATWEIGTYDDPLVACGLCILFDTTEADAEVW